MNPGAHFPENGKSDTTALILSATVHLLLLAALFFGVQWKSKAPASVEVEVWRAAPAPKPVTRPEPKKPEPRPEPKPEPKPKPKAEPPPPPKPDIAVKDKKKPKPVPKQPEPKPEPKTEEPAWKKELAKDLAKAEKMVERQKAIEADRVRAATEASLQAQIKAEQAASARTRGIADYAAKVRGRIRNNIVLPANIQGNPEGIYEVTQLPSGDIIGVKTRKSSGNRMLDDAIERAIWKSNPLPKPDNPAYFERILKIPYRPFEE